jgi:hypothetical protein
LTTCAIFTPTRAFDPLDLSKTTICRVFHDPLDHAFLRAYLCIPIRLQRVFIAYLKRKAKKEASLFPA